MSAIESTSPVLRGVQITQEAPPKSPFASTSVGSPFTASPTTSNGVNGLKGNAAASAGSSPANRSLEPVTNNFIAPLSIGPDGSPGPEINPITGSPENSAAAATRQVSWNIAKNTVREYEISETQPSEDDWEYRQGNCCCSIQ